MTQVSMADTLAFNQFVDQPFQTTLCNRVLFDGIGLHSGRFVELSICPAPANSGIKFKRIDVDTKRQTVEAHARFAEEARLCTRIVNVDGIGLETIEHMMAAFAGVGLDNAVVEINAPEAPILDGSSQPFVDAIKSVGLELLPARRKHIIVTKSVMVGLNNGAWARLDPCRHLEINIEITFDDAAIGNQTLTYRHGNGSFAAELARARTFCQLRDVELLKNCGLVLGGSLNNAVVVDGGRILNDGVEIFQIDATRPTINSYMFADAKAISKIASLNNDIKKVEEFEKKANKIKQELQGRLWNKNLNFFTVLPKIYEENTKPLDIRELIGYVPWYFNLPDDNEEFSLAWEKIKDSTGFAAPLGLTVTEQSHPFFKISYEGPECQWNGPSWPFATTQTLKAMANFLTNYSNNKTLKANVSLIINNADLAGKIAKNFYS